MRAQLMYLRRLLRRRQIALPTAQVLLIEDGEAGNRGETAPVNAGECLRVAADTALIFALQQALAWRNVESSGFLR